MAAWIVIMAGGGGTRLWPLSRRKHPKQFLPLLPGGETLLGATVRRCAPIVPLERTLVVSVASQVEDVYRALPGLERENLVVEPEGRNTAPCIGLAALAVARRDPTAVMAVLPSDQFVTDEPAFVQAVRDALALAGRGEVVALGIRPTHPETGFGYIRCSGADEARRVEAFVEKPDRATAERYLASGQYLWNAGMFFFSAVRIRAEIERHMPELGALLSEIARAREEEVDRIGELYKRAPKVSIDYGVMEKLGGAMWVIPADIGWSDVGSWAALPEVRPLDGAGNTVIGEALAVDARGNVLVGNGPLVAVVGVDDLVVVATRDAVLVVPRARAQEVKRIVETLEASRREPYL